MSDVMRPESMVKKGAPLRGRASKPTVIVISGEDNVKVASSSSTVRVGRQVVFKIEPNVPVPPKQKQLLLLPNRIASISHNKKLVKVSSRLKAQDGGWLIKSQKILLLVLSIYLNQFGQFTGDQNWIKAATAQHRLAAGHKQQQQHETRAEQLISYVEPHQGDQVRSLRSAELVARSIGGQQGNGGALKPLNDNQLQPGELANRCSGHLDDRAAYGQAQNFEPLNKEQEEILRSIRIYYNLNDTQSVAYTIGQSNQERQQQQLQQPTKDKIGNGADTARPANELAVKRLPPLPRPSNLSVLIISWYPPILKLSWNLDEFEGQSGGGGSFGPHERHQRPGQPPWDQQQKEWRGKDNSINNNNALETNGTPSTTTTRAKATKTSLPRSNDNNDDNRSAAANAFVGTENEPGGFGGAGFDLELALEQADKEPSNENGSLAKHLRELKLRRFLVNKSLTCFQVTYNVVNSRFKVIEEYPPYLRSVLLERLLPATEYSLRVSAIYLNGRFRATSQRVQFISPTDNESRRFKENTYRPIHSYPDEQREVQIGLAQVRGEELTLVGIAVFFWIATICLFFNKWGKIRMLEPYQPAYREQLDVGSVTVGPTTPQMQLGSTGDGSGSPGGHTIAGAGLIGPSGAPGQMYAAATALSPSSSSYNLQQHQHHQLLASAAAAATVPQSSQDSAPPPPPTGSSSPTLPTAGATMTSSLDKATTAGPIVDKLGSNKHRTSENGGAALAATATVTGELATRKASMVLAGSGKRFGQPATIDYPLDVQARLVGSGAVSSSSKQPLLGRRAIGGTGTTSQLNYLFQSKAQALAKASLMWPTLSQPATLGASSGGVGSVGGPSVGGTGVIGAASLGQKFKQEQYRTKFGSSVTNATTELETLRRLGECLAARRHLSRMGATGGGGNPPANYSLTSQLIGAGGPFERLSKHASCDSNEQQHKHSLGHYQQPHQHHYHPMHHYGQPQQQQPHLKTGSAWKVLENFKENRPLFAGNRSQQQQKPGPGSGVHSFESAQGQEDVFSKLTAELGRSGKTGASSLSPQSSRILRPSRTESQSPTDGSQEPLQPVSSSTTTLGWSQVASAGNPGLQQQQQQHQHQKQQHQQQRRSVSSGSSAKSHLLSRFIRRNPAIDQTTNLSQRDSLRTATQSLDQSTSDSLASAQNSQRFETSSQQAAGTSIDQEQGGRDLPFQRLRRLQFVSKLHQHHHIAQSVSTSTLTKQSYYQQQNQQQQHSSQHTFESSSKANSLSLDSRELHHQPPPQVQLVAPADDGDVDEQQQQQRKQQQQQPSRRIGSKPSSLDLATQQQQQQQESGTLIEHHILIEPPSPPNIKQTMNLQDERDGEDDEPEERSKVSGADGTDDQQPVATAADSNAGGCGSVRSADESSQIRPSVSAFALLDSRQAAGLQQKPQQQDHDVRGRDEGLTEAETANTFRPTDSDSRIDIGETQTTQVAQTQHYHQPEICLDDSLLSGGDDASECRSEPVIRPISPAAASDIVVLEAPPLGTSGRRTSSSGREDAFKKLASTYRASTERRLSRLACARSSGQLSSVANWGGGQYCAQSWSAMGLCQAANMLESGRGAGDLSGGDHQAPSCSSSGGGATTTTATASGSTGRPPIRLYSICSASGLGQQQDDYLLRPDQAGGQASSTTMVPSPSRASLSVHVGHHSQQQQQPPHQHHHRQQQQQQQQQPTKRVRRCSFCNSIECANQQAALAIHQIRAIQLQQQQQQQQQQQRQKLAASHQGFWSAGSQQQPAIVSSDSEETTTTGRLDWPRAPLQPTVDHDDMDELDDGRHSMAGGGGPPISSSSTSRSRVSSVFAGSPYARSHRRDSFVMLRALSQKKSKSAEDIAYLSSLVLQIWTREPNPLLQNVSQLQAARSSELQAAAAASHGGTSDAEHHHQQQYQRSRRRSSSNLQAQSSAGGGGRLPDSDQRRQSAGPGGPSGGSADDDLAGARPQASTGQARRKRPKSSLTVAADY